MSAVPSSLRVPANGLLHHVLEWPGSDQGDTALLLHGFMDAAQTWDLVAPPLAARGLRVLAPDLRGFGDAPRVPAGGYYYFTDYVHDVADLVDALVPASARLFLVGHSMGGSVATMYAGAFPERATRLAVIEGAGPPDSQHEFAPERLRGWIEDVRATRARPERSYPSRADALGRLAANHSRIPETVLRTRFDALARTLPAGRIAWKADPLHATRAPVLFFAESWMAFARRVTCPVLFVSGGPLGWHPHDEEARIGSFSTLERAEIDDAGHMMHWTHPAELSDLLLRFFGLGS
jgi:pimeloyl-ACP methyl ester carboxylesterase